MSSREAHWVELRIHGVSGTPPESMLCSAHAAQVAGDEWGGVYRPRDSLGQPLRPAPDRILEGYHWGRYTSGSWRHALWLSLIPFGLVNAAAFMVPHPRSESWLQRALHYGIGALLRVIGLGLTCALALTSSLVAVDVVAWRGSFGLDWVDAHVPAGVRVLAGLVLAAAGILVIARLAWSRRRRDPLDAAPPGAIAHVQSPTGLRRREFYVTNGEYPILYRLHLSAALGTVALVALGVADAAGDGAMTELGTTAALLLIAVVLGATLLLEDEEASASGTTMHPVRNERALRPLTWGLLGVAVLLVVVAAGSVVTMPPSETMMNVEAPARFLAVSMAWAVTLLAVLSLWLGLLDRSEHPDRPRRFRPYAWGLAPFAAAAAGVYLGVGFSGAALLGASRLFGVEVTTPLIDRIAYSWGLTLGLLLVLACVAVVVATRWRRLLGGELEAAFQGITSSKGAPLSVPGEWLRRAATSAGLARLKNCIPVFFLVPAVAGLAMHWVTVVEMEGRRLDRFAVGHLSADRYDGPFAVGAITVGTSVLVGLAGLLVYLGRAGVNAQRTRRAVNVVWDVVSFWPHAVHPFVPAAYSQFAVHDLRRRIQFHLGRLPTQPEDGLADHVVVAAHSQGSLVAFAAMLWLSPDERARVGLLTFGSQLQVAFPRAFPAYVSFDLVRDVYAALDGGGRPRWLNLYRETDPIAGPVLSWDRAAVSSGRRLTSYRVDSPDTALPDRVNPHTGRRECGNDWRLLDPSPADRGLLHGAVARLRGHGDFPDCPDWEDAVAAVRPSPPAAQADRSRQRSGQRETVG